MFDVLTEERARKESLEARGVALVTASGAFVTLVLAVTTLGGQTHLPWPARWLLVVASVCFLVSAACGAWLNKPVDYDEPSADSLSKVIDGGWGRASSVARKAVALNMVKVLGVARIANDQKACWLSAGSALHVAAIVCVATAAAIAVATGG